VIPTIRRRSLYKQDSGFSLPELIIAMGLLSIVMTLVVTFFVTFSTTFTKERAATDSTNVAAIGMNVITKVVRAGTIIDLKTLPDLSVFVKADDESVILHSYLADDAIDPQPVLIELSIDSDRELIESRWSATKVSEGWNFPNALSNPQPAPEISRVVARKIIAPPPGGAPLFT
jgi:prepilin-type N-terminal cleavage/methylation domain-containing protein